MTPLLIIQWIAAALVAKFAAPFFGINLDVFKPNNGSGAGSYPPGVSPSPKATLADPSSLWAIAAVGLVGVFVVSQLRAAGRELGAGLRGVYSEAAPLRGR